MSDAQSIAALDVREIVKQFAQVRAVDGLSFRVEPGEIFALLGPNGAGKTTLVRMLLGIIHPDAGRIAWRLDETGERAPNPRLLGYLPEERGLHKDVPVLRSLVYFGMLRGMPRAAARRSANEWLERLELSERRTEKLGALSKGNQQKVQFAAAILHGPAFAVLDEPFSGFDPVNQERFLEHIDALRAAGTTILLSAHQMQLVERAADRILLIDRGRALLEGTLDQIRERFGVKRRLRLTLLGSPDQGVTRETLLACPGVLTVNMGARNPNEDAGAPDAIGVTPTAVQLDLEGDGPLNDILAELARRATIVSVHDEQPTLHDIYIEAVERAKETAR